MKKQAQIYYANKSRYIGVFDSREKAAKAYEIVRNELQNTGHNYCGSQQGLMSLDSQAKFNAARKKAFQAICRETKTLG